MCQFPVSHNVAHHAREVMRRCDVLAAHSEVAGQLTRTFLSEPMHAVHRDLRTWLEAASAVVRIDPAGNIIGRYAADDTLSENKPQTLLIGSHVDTVRNAGRYDGMLGVLVGIGLCALLAELEVQLPFHIDVVGFSEEEGVRFALPFIGSRALCGTFDRADLTRTDQIGITLQEAISHYGLNPEAIPQAAYDPQAVLCFAEVHHEQGPVLATANQPVGIVGAIVGQSRAQVVFTGKAGHAGTTPMVGRQDALSAASEWVMAVERYAQGVPGMVATVGVCEVLPNAVNVIAAEVRVSLDLRHADNEVRHLAVQELRAEAQRIATRRTISLMWRSTSAQDAVKMDASLTAELQATMPHAPLMVSGAGHDAMIMAAFCPTALVFVRAPNAISHHPDETVAGEDVAVALDMLLRFVQRLAKQKIGEQ